MTNYKMIRVSKEAYEILMKISLYRKSNTLKKQYLGDIASEMIETYHFRD